MRSMLVIALVLAGCASDDPAPTVTVLSVSPDNINPLDDLTDDVRILIEYEDRDGDLGDGFAQVHDCRDEQLVTELPIPAIAPMDVIGEPIRGSMDLHLTDIGAGTSAALPALCDELGVSFAAGETVFCVVLVDAKDHEGPGDCTTPVTVYAP